MYTKIKVPVTLKTDNAMSREVAESVIMRANPHASMLVEQKLNEAEVTVENMMKYHQQIAAVVCEFMQSQYDYSVKLTLAPHEIRGLYLPNVMACIYASVGNITIGNYEFRLTRSRDVEIDRNFLIGFSAKLENVRDYVKGDVGQIGNRSAQPLATAMVAILYKIADDQRSGEVLIKDGATYDEAAAGLSALAGLTLVDEAYKILFTGVQEVNFRDATETLVDKGLIKARTVAEA